MTQYDQGASEDKERAFALFTDKQFGQAVSVYEAICQRCPEDQNSWMMQGLCYQAIGSLDKAISCLEQADNLEPPSADVLVKLGEAYLAKKRIDPAIQSFKEALEIQADHEEALVALGNALLMVGRYQETIESCQRAVQIFPDSVALRSQFAVSLEQLNRLEEAREAANEVLARQPNHPRAAFVLAKIEHRAGKLDEARSRLVTLLNTQLPAQQYCAIAAELGRVLDKMGDYQEAFNAFTAGNVALASTVKEMEVNVDELFDTIDLYRQWFSPETTLGWLEATKDMEESRPSPIFLVGFPRSETTLTEQIIAVDNNIVPSDEQPIIFRLISELSVILERPVSYPICLEELSVADLQKLKERYWQLAAEMVPALGEQNQFLDKLPLNLIDLGLIYRLFPKSKIIVVLRDPRDACLSCFMQSFFLNQATVNFLSLERTASLYDATMDLWRHYRSFMKFPYLEVRYENLTNDTEAEIRKLVEFLGLQWSDRFLTYEKAGARDIKTPSYSAVSQPIYQQATGRWLHYRDQLAPVMKILEPYVEEFGYERDILPPGMIALPTLPDHIKLAFDTAGGVGCSFALVPTGGKETSLGIIAAVPGENRIQSRDRVNVQLHLKIHPMPSGVVLQVILTATKLFQEEVDMDIIIDPLNSQQAALLEQIASLKKMGVFFYDAKTGDLIAGNEIVVDDILEGEIERVLEKARKHTASIANPNFQSAVDELSKELSM